MYGGDKQAPEGQGQYSSDALYAAAMMAAMEEEQRRERTYRYLEGLLPLVLLALIGLFLGYKMGLFDLSFIPFFNKPVSVLVLTDNGNAPEIKNLSSALTSQYARYLSIQLSKRQISPTTRIYASNLAEYDVVILYQTERKILSQQQRKELEKYVKGGGKLIIVKNSGTYMPRCDILGPNYSCDEAEWTGWKDLEDYVPVTCVDEESCAVSRIAARISSVDREHPIMGGLERIPEDEKAFLSLSVIKNISIAKNGRDIADIDEISGGKVVGSYPGIVVSTSVLGGKVVYFNYDPYETTILLVNTIDWLT